MKILFIGNSYTYYNDMPKIFESLARDNGKSVAVFSVTKGGRKLVAYENNEDPITVELDSQIKANHFDFCFIQEQSILPATDPDTFLKGVEIVVQKLKGHAEKLVMYQTWGRKEGSETLEKHRWSTKAMTELLAESYQMVANRYNALISPVGYSFLKITEQNPEINLHNPDLSHPSYEGSCLSALTHYCTVFGEIPSDTGALSLSTDVINAFLETVRESCMIKKRLTEK